jgi:HlyD family secretion protein
MSRRWIVVIAVLVVAAVGGYVLYEDNTASASAIVGFQTAPVTRGNLIATVNGAGPVAARAQVSLSFGQAGTVKQVYVALGDHVKQGQVLAELESADVQIAYATAIATFNQQQLNYNKVAAGPTAASLESAQSAVTSAQSAYDAAVRASKTKDAQLLIAKNTLDSAGLKLESAQKALTDAVSNHVTDLTALNAAVLQAKDDYASTQAQYDLQVAGIDDSGVRAAASALSTAQAALVALQSSPTQDDLQIATDQIEQARIAMQQTENKLRNIQIVAPFDGVITQVNIDNFYAATISTAAFQISDLNALQVTANLAEVDIEKIKQGQTVNVSLDALPDRPALQGVVDQVALTGVTTQGVVNYPIVIKLANADPKVILTGMTANVAIVVDRRDNVLMVPSRAIHTVGKAKIVSVQTAPGVVQQVPVTVGLQNDSQSEIVSGLNQGDQVVISNLPASRTSGPGGPGGGFRLPGFGGR